MEAKAVALSAELKFCKPKRHCMPCHHHDEPGSDVGGLFGEPNEVLVTIGLFSIIKVFRIVNLTVQSHGFCIPEEGQEISPLNPCDFFDNLDFPLDIFCPPQKPEFFAGVSNNLKNDKCEHPHGHHHHDHCHNHDHHCHKHDHCDDKHHCHKPEHDDCHEHHDHCDEVCEYPHPHKKHKKGYYK